MPLPAQLTPRLSWGDAASPATMSSGSSGMRPLAMGPLLKRVEHKTAQEKFAERYALQHRSLFLFSGDNPVRLYVANLVSTTAFSGGILLLILVNAAILMLQSKTLILPELMLSVLHYTEIAITGIFAVEVVMRAMAMGLILHPGAYLRSPSYLGCSYWNLFDFCIVLAGVLDIFFSSSPIVLRTLRILRPLRSITALPDLKALVCAVTASATDLLCICAFVGFVTITFATIGVSFWKGQFRLRCLDEATGGLAGGVEEFCSLSPGPLTHSCSRGACGPWHSNPNYNFTSFDNLGAAALVIVQVLCLDGWPMPMYITMDTSGVFSCLFFIVLVLVSNAVINNFVLAVIVHQYNRRCCEALAEKRQAGATVGMCAAEAAAGGLMKDELSHTDSDLTTTAGDTSPRFDLEQQPKAFGPDMGVRSASKVKQQLERFLPQQPNRTEEVDSSVEFQSLMKRNSGDSSTPSTCTPPPNSRPIDPEAEGTTSDDRAAPSACPPPAPATPNAASVTGTAVEASDSPDPDAQDEDRPSAPAPASEPPPGPGPGPGAGAPPADAPEDIGLRDSPKVDSPTGGFPVALPSMVPPPSPPGLRSRDGLPASRFAGQSRPPTEPAPPFPLEHLPLGRRMTMPETRQAWQALADTGVARRRRSAAESFGTVAETSHNSNDTSNGSNGGSGLPMQSAAGGDGAGHAGLTVVDLGPPVTGVGEPPGGEGPLCEPNDAASSPHVPELALPSGRRCGALGRVYVWLAAQAERVVFHVAFLYFIMLCIVCNTVVLAMAHHNMPHRMEEALDIANVVLTSVFTVELLLKLCALGSQFHHDPFNILDAFIVATSLLEFLFTGRGALTVFRSLRLLRVLKMINSFSTLRLIVEVILKATLKTGYLSLLLLLLLFIWALLGMSFFEGIFGEGDGRKPTLSRSSFDGFYWSFITVFTILTRDDWQIVMWDTMHYSHPAACTYFITLVILGDWVLVSLFLAVVIQGFNEQYRQPTKRASSSSSRFHSLFSIKSSPLPEMTSCLMVRSPAAQYMRVKWVGFVFPVPVPYPPSALHYKLETKAQGLPTCRTRRMTLSQVGDLVLECEDGLKRRFSNPLIPRTLQLGGIGLEPVGGASLVTAYCSAYVGLYRTIYVNGGRSLCVFGPCNPFRIFCVSLAQHRWTQHVILFAILTSSVLLAFPVESDKPGRTLNQRGVTLPLSLAWTTDLFFAGFFLLEMMMNIVAYGLLFNEGAHPEYPAYLRNHWNLLDFVVVMMSAVSVMPFTGVNASYLRIFRVLRCMRPLRLLRRFQGLRVVVHALLESVPHVIDLVVISSLFMLMFGILGVELFGGKLYHCTDPLVTHHAGCVGNFSSPITHDVTERQWVNKYPQHYDNVFSSTLTVFEVTTRAMWKDIMYHTIEGISNDEAPRYDDQAARRYGCIYFIFVTIICGVFTTSLFAGLVIVDFAVVKMETQGLYMLTNPQRLWVEMQQIVLNLKPARKPRPYFQNQFCIRMFHIVQHHAFECAVVLTIVLNVFLMCLDHHEMSAAFEKVWRYGNLSFCVIYTAEAICKICGYGPNYFRNNWDRFDFTLMALGWGDIIGDFDGALNPNVLRAFRTTRILRVARLLRKSRRIRVLIHTLWCVMPVVSNIACFMLFLFMIYSVLGMHLFSHIKEGTHLKRNANFSNFAVAMLTLFRISSGADWNGLMHDMMISEGCTEGVDCGSPILAPIYYVSFLLLASFILLNLFVAVVLDQFKINVAFEADRTKSIEITKFVRLWEIHDPDATHTIPTRAFPAFLQQLGEPLGLQPQWTNMDLLLKLREFSIIEHGGVVHYVEALVSFAHLSHFETLTRPLLKRQEQDWRMAFPELYELPVQHCQGVRVTLLQHFAASTLAAGYRQYKARQRCEQLRRDLNMGPSALSRALKRRHKERRRCSLNLLSYNRRSRFSITLTAPEASGSGSDGSAAGTSPKRADLTDSSEGADPELQPEAARASGPGLDGDGGHDVDSDAVVNPDAAHGSDPRRAADAGLPQHRDPHPALDQKWVVGSDADPNAVPGPTLIPSAAASHTSHDGPAPNAAADARAHPAPGPCPGPNPDRHPAHGTDTAHGPDTPPQSSARTPSQSSPRSSTPAALLPPPLRATGVAGARATAARAASLPATAGSGVPPRRTTTPDPSPTRTPNPLKPGNGSSPGGTPPAHCPAPASPSTPPVHDPAPDPTLHPDRNPVPTSKSEPAGWSRVLSDASSVLDRNVSLDLDPIPDSGRVRHRQSDPFPNSTIGGYACLPTDPSWTLGLDPESATGPRGQFPREASSPREESWLLRSATAGESDLASPTTVTRSFGLRSFEQSDDLATLLDAAGKSNGTR